MITAIPLTNDRLSNHFTKAEYIMFIDENGQLIEKIVNPALSSNCSGKSEMLAKITEQGATHILVKNIGERMYARLARAGLVILQAKTARQDVLSILSESNYDVMNTPENARRSTNYEKKQANGGCHHHHADTTEKHPFTFVGHGQQPTNGSFIRKEHRNGRGRCHH